MEDIDAAGLEDVREFFRSYYTPDNAVLVLAGDLEPERGFDLADRYFGDIPQGPGPVQVTAPQVPPGAEKRDAIYDNVQFPRVYLFHHAPAFGQPGFESADVLCYLLSDGKSSRLYQKLVYEDRIALDVAAQVWPTEDCGISFIVATARPGVDAETLESGILEVLTDMQNGAIEEDEAVGGVNRSLRELVNTLDGVGTRSDAIATSATFLNRPGYVNELFGRMQDVTLESMLDVAGEWFVPQRRATLHVLPERAAGETE
jgi:zinc protease